MSGGERPLAFNCGADRLIGILTPAREGPGARRPAIVIVVGGPQYRIGSHRQFVAQARAWSRAGYDVLRFDCRGMGDSDGAPRNFLEVQDDIRVAVDAVYREIPGLPGVVLFGLCDAVPAILDFAPADERIVGLMMANPWVRSQASEARATLKHYYARRLLQPSFWSKILKGELPPKRTWRSFVGTLKGTRQDGGSSFVDAMLAGWNRFGGQSCVFISGTDLTAAEFTDLCARDSNWGAAIASNRVQLVRLPDADHTFSTRRELDLFISASVAWLETCV